MNKQTKNYELICLMFYTHTNNHLFVSLIHGIYTKYLQKHLLWTFYNQQMGEMNKRKNEKIKIQKNEKRKTKKEWKY